MALYTICEIHASADENDDPINDPYWLIEDFQAEVPEPWQAGGRFSEDYSSMSDLIDLLFWRRDYEWYYHWLGVDRDVN